MSFSNSLPPPSSFSSFILISCVRMKSSFNFTHMDSYFIQFYLLKSSSFPYLCLYQSSINEWLLFICSLFYSIENGGYFFIPPSTPQKILFLNYFIISSDSWSGKSFSLLLFFCSFLDIVLFLYVSICILEWSFKFFSQFAYLFPSSWEVSKLGPNWPECCFVWPEAKNVFYI